MKTLQDLHKKDIITGRVITYEKWKKKVKEETLKKWVELTEKEKVRFKGEFEIFYQKKWTEVAVELDSRYEHVDGDGIPFDLPF